MAIFDRRPLDITKIAQLKVTSLLARLIETWKILWKNNTRAKVQY